MLYLLLVARTKTLIVYLKKKKKRLKFQNRLEEKTKTNILTTLEYLNGQLFRIGKYWNTTTDNCVQYVSRWSSIIVLWYSIRLVMAVFNLYVPSNNQPCL